MEWNSELPIYASENFLRTVGDEYGWIGGTDECGKLRCFLPYTVVRKPGFRMVRFRAETFCFDGELSKEEEKAFLNRAVDYFRSVGTDLILPASNNTIFQTYPDGARPAPYGTFIKDLRQDEEAMLAEVHTDFRQNIRKAAKTGIEVKSGMQYLDAAYELIAATLLRSGMKFRDHADFKQILLGLGEHIKIFVAEQNGVIQACMVSPFSQHTAYDWYSGTVPKPARGAMHLLLWEALRDFHQQGVKFFNFTGVRVNPEKGSKQEGIWNFKMRFGGKLVEGYMWKYSFHPLKFAAYTAAMRLLKGGDIVDQEGYKLEDEPVVS
jgi:hypothetical protein